MAPTRTVLITGAASGIGRALAHRYAQPGTTLLLIGQRSPDETAAELQGSGATIRTAAADVRDAAALSAAVAELAGETSLDVVVHCAGILPPVEPLASVKPEDFQRTVDVNLTGSFNLVHAVLPHLTAGSSLGLIASMGGLVAGYRYPAYSASKFGVVGLGETIRMELAPRGIRTHVICPGEVSTPMVDDEIAAGDQVQRAVKLMSGAPITALQAADAIAKGIDAGQFLIITSRQPKLLSLVVRFSPIRARHLFTDLSIKQAQRAAARGRR